MSEEPEEESSDEVEEDFDGEVAEEIDEDDIDLGDIDDDHVGDFDEEDEPRSSSGGGGGGSRTDDADLLAPNFEQAVKANPKRQSVQRKRARLIEGILDTAELTTSEGAAKAWQALQKQAGDAKPRKYALKDEYTENDVVVHPAFGEGYVVEILTSTKMTVLFEDGIKRLAHNRA